MKPATYYRRCWQEDMVIVERLDADHFLVAEGYSIVKFRVDDPLFESRLVFPSFPAEVGEVVLSHGPDSVGRPQPKSSVLAATWNKIATTSLHDSLYLTKVDSRQGKGLASVFITPAETRSRWRLVVSQHYLDLFATRNGLRTYRGTDPKSALYVDVNAEQIAVIMPMLVGYRQDDLLWEAAS